MDKYNYIIGLALHEIKPEDADPPIHEDEMNLYRECVATLKRAEEEGRTVILYVPDDY